MNEYIVRIDQGDYLVERGAGDWGRNSSASARRPWAGATVYASIEEAREAVRRLGVSRITRAIEPLPV